MDAKMVRGILQKIFTIFVLATLLYGCNQVTTEPKNTTDPTVITVPVETTIPAQPTKIVEEHPVPVVPNEYWDKLWQLSKRSFSLMFGEECIKETPKNSYAIIQRESGEKYIVFFDENERIDGPWFLERGVFHSNAEFLDFIGSNPTMDEMSAYDNFRIYIHDLEAYYTQEGVFLIAFHYSTIYIDEIPQGTERRLRVIAYYDYEELITAQDPYSYRVWYILPEDRK